MKRRTFNTMLAAAGLGLATIAPAGHAQPAWPEGRPISLVVPYAPGGTADALARLIAQHLGPKLGTSVVVMNRAGASGIIGQQFVAQAAPDGLTFLYDATPLSINPHLQKLSFDPEQDLLPVTMVAVTPMLMAVPKNSPHQTLQDFVKAAKTAPGKLTFGSGGQGTVQYMGAELFNQAVDIKLLHVPYRSGGLAITANLAGETDMGFANLPAIGGHVQSGMLRPLAITSAQRHPLHPNVPTISEVIGRPYEVHEWNGVFAPRGTSPATLARMQVAIKEVLTMPEVRERFDALGSRIVASSPDEFRKFLAEESGRWAATVKAAGIRKE